MDIRCGLAFATAAQHVLLVNYASVIQSASVILVSMAGLPLNRLPMNHALSSSAKLRLFGIPESSIAEA
jgi:hypothetical protein